MPWKRVDSDEEFAQLFVGASIKTASPVSLPGNPRGIEADMYWELSDGTWLAMQLIYRSEDCDTCGWGGGIEKQFFILKPEDGK